MLNFRCTIRLEISIIQYWEQIKTEKIPGETEGSGMVQKRLLQNIVLFFSEVTKEKIKCVGQ